MLLRQPNTFIQTNLNIFYLNMSLNKILNPPTIREKNVSGLSRNLT